MTARPEWTCSSSTSSVVNDRGPLEAKGVGQHVWKGVAFLGRTFEEDGETVIQQVTTYGVYDATAVHFGRFWDVFRVARCSFQTTFDHSSPYIQRP